MEKETPVFDRRDTPTAISLDAGEWSPRRTRMKRGDVVLMEGDPLPKIFLSVAPHDEVERFRANGTAWYASNGFDGQAANDNADWPLQKLLRTEGKDYFLSLAGRYRDLHDTASRPMQLIGKECENLFFVENQDAEGRSKGTKVVTGKKVNADTAPTKKTTAGETTRKLAAPVPKKWNGDWPILAAIDAKRELAILRAKLAYVPAILEAFEWSVVDGLTLDEIGKRLGAGSKGAKGEARARIFDGFGIVDRHWRTQDRLAA
ncbi:hypothetical protein [Agrobacterium tumefaciens]|uniref:hypothetical protein n=1 Tax=Agrobacterium tumefaciens TaxID=358 RepID=UPI0021CE0359|nr:hypothetical protein [Agrobacterium tumefaciens]UXS08698.1 hypothetical protein FY155_03410 [Agrobacterium tumefaciens]UXS16058.1 hypothetical protein FY154_03405 [Agrobacterium tumefaciens]